MTGRLITEFIGTFFLVLTIGLTVLIGTDFAPVAIGAVLVALVYMGGHVSKAHYNPAVTLAMWMRGVTPSREVGPYVGAQTAAAFAAAWVAFVVNDRPLQVMPNPETGSFEFFLLELLFTFILVLVILNVALSRDLEGNEMYGVAIGFVVMGGAFAAGPISGGAFNPAVALGPALVDLLAGNGASLASLWVYLVATFAGAALAAWVFPLQSPRDA